MIRDAASSHAGIAFIDLIIGLSLTLLPLASSIQALQRSRFGGHVMKRLVLALALAFSATCMSVSPAHAYEAGTRYGGFSYPNFPSYSLALAAWFNVDPASDRARGYGYTDAPNVSGFRSSAMSRMTYLFCTGNVCESFIEGNRIYGNTERLTSSTYLLICSTAGQTYFSTEYWQTTDAYDYNYSGAFQSNHVYIPANCG